MKALTEPAIFSFYFSLCDNSMKVTDFIGCTGWVVLFIISSICIPVAGPLIGLVTSLPFLYYSVKLGLYQGLKIAVTSVLVIILFAYSVGQEQLVFFVIQFAVLGLTLSIMFEYGFSLAQTVVAATVVMLCMNAGFLILVCMLKDTSVHNMIVSYLQHQIKLTLQAYREMSVPNERVLELQARASSLINIIATIYPSLMTIGSGLVVLLNIAAAKVLFRLKALRYPDFEPVDRWRAPDSLVWVVIFSGFTLLLTSGWIKSLSLNIFIVTIMIYICHGFSILAFFMNRYKVQTWVKILVYSILAVQQIFLGVLALIGLFDQWIDFRKIQKSDLG